MRQPLRLLVVSDSEHETQLLVRALYAHDCKPQHTRVEDAIALSLALDAGPWKIVVCDSSLERFSTLDALRLVRQLDVDVPFIVMASPDTESLAAHALANGAQDCVSKGDWARLGRVVQSELDTASTRTELRALRAELAARTRKQDCIRTVSEILHSEARLDQALDGVARAMPCGWQYPNTTCVRVRIDRSSHSSKPFAESEWRQASDIVVGGKVRGMLEVFYREARPSRDEGPFLQQERELLNELASRVGHAIQLVSLQARAHHLETVLRAIRNVNQLIVRGEGPASLVEQACREIVATRGFHTAWVYLNHDAPGGQRTIERGWGEAFCGLAEKLQKGELPHCCKLASESRGVVAIREPAKLCSGCPLATQYDSGGNQPDEVLVTPLEMDGKAYGFMCISLVPDLATDEEKTSLLSEVAADIAFALRAIDLEAERQRADEALKKEALRRHVLMDASRDGICIINQLHEVVEANQSFGKMLGYSAQEVLELHTWDWEAMLTEAQVRAAFADLTQTSVTFETRHRRKDGSVYDAEVSASGARVGDEAMVFTVSRDLTEKKNLQASLAQSDRLASMGMLAAGVAHEINNPLAYVLFNLETLSDDIPLLGEALRVSREALERHLGSETTRQILGGQSDTPTFLDFNDLAERFQDALSGTRRIKAIARALSTFSRVERDQLVSVNIHHTIECAVNMAFNEIKYRARLVKDYGHIFNTLASEGCLSQVFLNLIINAAHAIDEGDVAKNEIRIRTWQEGSEACIEVRDTGEGIPRENLERIFEPFFSTKKVGFGSGLGLAISRSIVEGYSGRIEVQSDYGKGASFVVRLPTGLPDPVELGPVKVGPPTRSVRGRILIIDDEPGIRRSLARLLHQHEVVAASSGEAGRGILKEDQRFDLILCDVMMPAVSGAELHEWLVKQYPALAKRVVFITGGAFASSAAAYLAKVDNPCVNKPFDAAHLARMVADLIVVYRRTE